MIECLKYACTGILPPGTKNGHSFVNDPSMTDATEVKASIRLKFKNKRKLEELVSRSFQLTKKSRKDEFKALDGVIKHYNGEKTESITQKCSDLDKIVPELLVFFTINRINTIPFLNAYIQFRESLPLSWKMSYFVTRKNHVGHYLRGLS